VSETNDERVRRALEPGRSILVGTVDAANIPSCCRAVALASGDDLATATVYIPIAVCQQTLQNVATTGRIAVVTAHPIDHCSIQLKGTTTDVRLAREDEAAFLRERLEDWAGVLDKIGVPRRLVRSTAGWPAFAVTLRVEQIFEQTPGPRAGGRLR
jgi:hypothetical protein